MLFYHVYCAKFGTTSKLIRDDFICCFINQSSIIASQLGYCFTDIEVSDLQFLAHIAPGIKKIEGCVKN